SMQNAGMLQNMGFQKDRMKDLLKQADDMAQSISLMRQMYSLMQQLSNTTHHMVGETHDIENVLVELEANISDFEDFWRPIRSYFYWEKHCYDIPICFSLKSIFDTLDEVDLESDKLHDLTNDLNGRDALLPQLLETFPPMIENMEHARTMILKMSSTMGGMFNAMDESADTATAMGQAFDQAKNDDSFFLP